MLSAEDLAYMRETQAEARPTEAELLRRTQTTTATGGRTDTWAAPVLVGVRLDGREQGVPERVTAKAGAAKAIKITMDLVEVRDGDLLKIGAEEYQIITDGDPDQWATAQVVWAKRTKAPPRG